MKNVHETESPAWQTQMEINERQAEEQRAHAVKQTQPPACANCLFFQPDTSEVPMYDGECRRRAPTFEQRWPRVPSSGWCGEGRARST